MEYLPYLTKAQQNLLLKPILLKRYLRGENIDLPPSTPPELPQVAERLISTIPFNLNFVPSLFSLTPASSEGQLTPPTESSESPSEASSFVGAKSESDTDGDWDKVDDFARDATESKWSNLSKSKTRPSSSPSLDPSKRMVTSPTLLTFPNHKDSEISNDSDYDPTQESFAERLSALRDIVPPTTRSWFWNKWLTTSRVVKGVVFFAGRSVWSISVSALLIGVPFALCWAEEQQVIAMEQEVRMREMGADVLTAGGPEGNTADILNQHLGKEGGVETKAAGL
ncbi:hypothetical protein VPNG_03365 [Cytospora leucostoma]|uniref:Mitochondrial import receptor subunit tom22 n=1 Tax=Cytospora leucostoma TaxID=1230097 RepID=A0A423XFG0_9PEZI|nr:hypothetical protein VPNG_03365 [Cytospora leucostoma]